MNKKTALLTLSFFYTMHGMEKKEPFSKPQEESLRTFFIYHIINTEDYKIFVATEHIKKIFLESLKEQSAELPEHYVAAYGEYFKNLKLESHFAFMQKVQGLWILYSGRTCDLWMPWGTLNLTSNSLPLTSEFLEKFNQFFLKNCKTIIAQEKIESGSGTYGPFHKITQVKDIALLNPDYCEDTDALYSSSISELYWNAMKNRYEEEIHSQYNK